MNASHRKKKSESFCCLCSHDTRNRALLCFYAWLVDWLATKFLESPLHIVQPATMHATRLNRCLIIHSIYFFLDGGNLMIRRKLQILSSASFRARTSSVKFDLFYAKKKQRRFFCMFSFSWLSSATPRVGERAKTMRKSLWRGVWVVCATRDRIESIADTSQQHRPTNNTNNMEGKWS